MSERSVDEILLVVNNYRLAKQAMSVIEAKQALLSLIEERLPPEVEEAWGDGRSYTGKATYNDCLDEVKSILREMFK